MGGIGGKPRLILLAFSLSILSISICSDHVWAQQLSHPRLFFNRTGMDEIRQRALFNPRLNKIWQRFKVERADSALRVDLSNGGLGSVNFGRSVGDALGDLAIAYIVLRDSVYAEKAIELMLNLAGRHTWGDRLVKGHISLGIALCWDVFYDQLSESARERMLEGVREHGQNRSHVDLLANANWTSAAGEGVLGLAFRGDGNDDFNEFAEWLVERAKTNFRDAPRSVLWAHGTDGFPHEGLGYWRKYIHIGLFLSALRQAEPGEDWFHLGREYPGSEFLRNTAYPRVYADVQHRDLATLTWADSRQVRGQYGNIGMLAMVASEYRDGYIFDFMDYVIDETGFEFDGEDWATFLFYNDENVPRKSYRSLPRSRYWPDMEAAIFRSGWANDDLVFYMRCGSPGGHARQLKDLTPGGHDHLDANGFVLFYNNDYLAAEDGYRPTTGPDEGENVKYTNGHNTFLIDGRGQRGDGTLDAATTRASMQYLDAPHVGFLLGDAADAYDDLDKFDRYVIYRKHHYIVVLDELGDETAHKYEYLLGTDNRHLVEDTGNNRFTISPKRGDAKLLVDFAEPQELNASIERDRLYSIEAEYTDMLHVSPVENTENAAFLSLLYPYDEDIATPKFQRIRGSGLTGYQMGPEEVILYNSLGDDFSYGAVKTDAKLSYVGVTEDTGLEFLASGMNHFAYDDEFRMHANRRVIAAFQGPIGKLRLDRDAGEVSIAIRSRGLRQVLVDGEEVASTKSDSGYFEFELTAKSHRIGPRGYQQTVIDNYDVLLIGEPFIRIISPNGGERLSGGTRETLIWLTDGSFSGVKLEFSPDAGQSWSTLIDNMANDGSAEWTVPQLASEHCLIRLVDADGTVSDVSDNVMSITQPPIITSVVPGIGVTGMEVTIKGEAFNHINVVRFGEVAAQSFFVDSSTRIRAIVPNAAKTGKISISARDGVASSQQEFTVFRESQPSNLVIKPNHDTFARSGRPENNYGDDNELRVRSATSGDNRSYLRFQVPDLQGTVARATIALYVSDGGDFGGHIFAVSNSSGDGTGSWTEDLLTWYNAPEINDAALDSVATVEPFTWIEFDVTAAIAGPGSYSFAITSHSPDGVKYQSKENDFSPELRIETAADSDALPKPFVTTITPGQGLPGDEIVIRGRYLTSVFGVLFSGAPAETFFAVSDSVLVVVVPEGAVTGPLSLLSAFGTLVTEHEFNIAPLIRIKTYRPSEDTFVRSAVPAGVYGYMDQFWVRGVDSDTVTAFLKFAATDLSGEVVSATLRLFVLREGNAGSVFEAENVLPDGQTEWDELLVTHLLAPDYSEDALSSLGFVPGGQNVTFDVTEAVTGPGVYSFAIASQSADLIRYASKEGAHPPELIIETNGSAGRIAAQSQLAKPTLDNQPADAQIPQELTLLPSYPNPFNLETMIEFGLPEQTRVELVVFNLRGQRVRELVNGHEEPGIHRVTWNGRNQGDREISSGIYFVQLIAGGERRVQKLILQK